MVHISALWALVTDTFATFVCQAGYMIQKKGHMSVEAHNAQVADPKDRKSGFLTLTWAIGISISFIAGFLHAGKIKKRKFVL